MYANTAEINMDVSSTLDVTGHTEITTITVSDCKIILVIPLVCVLSLIMIKLRIWRNHNFLKNIFKGKYGLW